MVVVNDNSTDQTEGIIDEFARTVPYIQKINISSSNSHMPGSKVINAFEKGLDILDNDFDFIVKLDADIVLPNDYFQKISKVFNKSSKLGIAGGFAYEQNEKGDWQLNHPMDKKHVRGAFKSYSNACFMDIGGLKTAMGWDTVDELLAQYHGYDIFTYEGLQVKHLRPTGKAYNAKAKLLQGQAMYTMRYGLLLSIIASLKMAVKLKKPKAFIDNLFGFCNAWGSGKPFMVTKDEGRFIRQLRWRNIKSKLIP